MTQGELDHACRAASETATLQREPRPANTSQARALFTENRKLLRRVRTLESIIKAVSRALSDLSDVDAVLDAKDLLTDALRESLRIALTRTGGRGTAVSPRAFA